MKFCDVSVKYQLRLHDAKTKKVIKVMPKVSNLVGDLGLNTMAQITNLAQISNNCAVGSGTNATSVNSGSITFSQAGTSTITASSSFFTSAMIGGIFKYGVGSAGQEQYITAVAGTTCTVAASNAGFPTISASVATVWFVNAQNLQTFLFNTTTYDSTAGANSTTYTTTGFTYQRTYIFPVQVTSYTVNEVGWSNNTISSSNNQTLGRAIVTSTVVPPTNFLSVVIQITFNYTPATPTAVANVNTVSGSLNTAGNAMIEMWAVPVVTSSGGTSNQNPPGNGLSQGQILNFCLTTSNYTQNSTPFSGTYPFTPNLVTPSTIASSTVSWGYVTQSNLSGIGTPAGTMQLNVNYSPTTSGQTVFGVCLTSNNGGTLNSVFDIKMTTPFVTPSGPFPVLATFTLTFGRTLVN